MGDSRDDAFEASEMHDGAPVVRRDKKITRRMAALVAVPGVLTVALAVFIAFANASSSKPVPAAALPFVVGGVAALGIALVALGIVFGVLRTIVTARAVHVKYGLWGPDVPLEAIASCRVVDYDWTEFGGWGIRRGKDGTWAYVPSSGRVLELRFREGGAMKRVLVGADDPDETARQIERARSQAADPGDRVRVDVGASPSERELDADEEASRDDARRRA